MDHGEAAEPFVCGECPGRAVFLVADDEVENRSTKLLGGRHPVEGLVGGEHAEERVLLFPGSLFGDLEVLGDLGRIGRRREGQVVDVEVLFVLGDLGVRADGHRVQRPLRVGAPCTEALGEKRDRRDTEANDTSGRHQPLREAQCGEGLPRATRHHELSPVRGRESLDHVGDRRVLVGAQRLRAMAMKLLGVLRVEPAPVERARRELSDADALHRDQLVCEHLLCVSAPALGGRDEEACRERAAARGDEEPVDVLSADRRVGRVELALDRTDPALALSCDEVDPGVRLAGGTSRPFVPLPHPREALGEEGILGQERLHEALEDVAPTLVRRHMGSDVLEEPSRATEYAGIALFGFGVTLVPKRQLRLGTGDVSSAAAPGAYRPPRLPVSYPVDPRDRPSTPRSTPYLASDFQPEDHHTVGRLIQSAEPPKPAVAYRAAVLGDEYEHGVGLLVQPRQRLLATGRPKVLGPFHGPIVPPSRRPLVACLLRSRGMLFCMTITCPRCGLAFESRATTATRCPSCRTVVHISRGTSSARSSSSQPQSRVERSYSDSDPGDGGVVVVILALVAFGGWVLWRWWRKREAQPNEARHSMEPGTGPYTFATSAPTSGPVGPEAGPALPALSDEHDATGAPTGPSEAK